MAGVTASMRAASLQGPGRIAVEQRARPEPGPGEVRVRVQACGICGSDLHFFHRGALPPGSVPGHEIAGIVDAVGGGVHDVEPGAPVAVEPLHSCGRCRWCRAGHHAICPEGQIHGVHRPGGLAEFVTVDAHRVFPVPPDLPPVVAALTEPMAVAVHGLARSGLAPGQRLLVLGAGTIGLLTVAAATAAGAGEVWVTARHAHQAEQARALGAGHVLTGADASPGALAALGREVPLDVVVETVGGSATTLADAARAVAPGGTVCVLGLFFGDVALPALDLMVKENAVVWSNCYGRAGSGPDFARAVELVAAHRDRLGDLVTHSVALDDVARGFALASDKASGAVKVSVLPTPA